MKNYVSACCLFERFYREGMLPINSCCFHELQRVPKAILDETRSKFAAARKTILGTQKRPCSKPWPPWALVNLLDIDDRNSPVPAEIMLYQALRPRRVGGLTLPNHDEIQVNVV